MPPSTRSSYPEPEPEPEPEPDLDLWRTHMPARTRVFLIGLGLGLGLGACTHSAVAPLTAPTSKPLPRLPPPDSLDPAARGAAYLDAVALQLQPGWGQFLDDCRVRLPAAHPLNVMSRVADVELAVDAAGRVAIVRAPASGDADFDRAVREVIADAAPLPAPPAELRSDDDRAHLRWRFARDRRQAGPATAAIVDVELPLGDVVAALLARGELGRAAARIARAPATDAARAPATTALMTAVLREALGSADGAARRAAVVAIGRAHVRALAGEVRAQLAPTTEAELRRVAIAAVVALGDGDAAGPLRDALATDVRVEPRLALDEARALVALGHASDAAAALAPGLDASPPNPAALAALAAVPEPARARQLDAWLAHGDPRTRAAVCAALAAPSTSRATLARGLRDPDASVRAACAAAATAPVGGTLGAPAPAVVRGLRDLLRDRDDAVRAAAVTALVSLELTPPPATAADPAPAVRAAFATALGASTSATAAVTLRALAEDRDADVRAAAFAACVARGGVPAELAAGVPNDPAVRVRRAAAPGISDPTLLALLAVDPDPLVASAALVRRAAALGAAAALAPALELVAASPPASAERVRAALAWLLAR